LKGQPEILNKKEKHKKTSLKGQPKIKISIIKRYAMLSPLISLKNMNELYFEYIEEMNDSLLCLLQQLNPNFHLQFYIYCCFIYKLHTPFLEANQC